MNTFRQDPLRILLAIFAGFGMLRSLLALLEAVTTEPARTRTVGLYLLILIAIVLGAYLILQPWPSGSGTSGDPAEETNKPSDSKGLEKTLGAKLVGAILLILASSLLLNSLLMPYLSLAPPATAPPETSITPPSETSLATPSQNVSATLQPSTPTLAPSSTLVRTSTPTPVPAGIRMQVTLPRVHVRQGPSSRSTSIGELNNGVWLYFDGRTLDVDGMFWLRIVPDQLEPSFERWSGNWVFAGGFDAVGLDDLPLLPATATPAG